MLGFVGVTYATYNPMSPTRIRRVLQLKCTLLALEGRVVERDLVAVVAAAVAVQLRKLNES